MKVMIELMMGLRPTQGSPAAKLELSVHVAAEMAVLASGSSAVALTEVCAAVPP